MENTIEIPENNSDIPNNNLIEQEEDVAKRKVLEITSDIIPGEERPVKEDKTEEVSKEEEKEEREAKLVKDAPEYAKEVFEDLTERQRTEWRTAIDRLAPLETKDGITLKIGEIVRFPGVVDKEEAAKLVEQTWGGGVYAWRALDGKSVTRTRQQFRVDGEPKPTKYEIEMSAGRKREDEKVGEEDKVKKAERKQRELEAELELKKTEKRYNKEIEKLEQEDEDEGEEGLDMSRFARSPEFMDFMQRRQSPKEIEEKIKIKLMLENENRELKQRIAAMEATLETLRDDNKKPGLDTKKILEIAAALIPLIAPIITALKPEKRDPVEDFKKISEAININKPPSLDQSEMMKVGMSILTNQLEASQKMMMSQMQLTLETSMEIMRKSVMDLSGIREPGDWRVELGAKALEAGQTFVKEIVGYNKEKLGVEKTKLDMIRNRQIRPVGQLPQKNQQVGETQPRNNVAPVTPEQTIEIPVVEQKPELGEEEKDIAKKINLEANALLNAMISGYISQVSPEVMVERTPELVGDTVMSYLLQCQGLGDIRELAKTDGKAELFDKYVIGIPDVKVWVEQYLDLLKKTYEITDENETEEEKTES